MKKIILFFSFGITMVVFGTALAATVEDFANAIFLSDRAIITTQTEPYQYRLDDKILRQEVIGMALKIRGVILPENYTCKKYFADATKNDWACRAVELAADNGIITRSNKYANPGKNITRAEALGIIRSSFPFLTYNSSMLGFTEDDFSSEYKAGWQKEIFLEGYGYGLFVSPNEFHPDQHATRAEIFGYAMKFLSTLEEQIKLGGRIFIGWGYEKDFYNVYLDGVILPGIDPNTFQIYENNYFSDKSGVYKYFSDNKSFYLIPNLNKYTLAIIGTRHVKDDKLVYHCDGFRDYTGDSLTYKCVQLIADANTFVCKGQNETECEDKDYYYSTFDQKTKK